MKQLHRRRFKVAIGMLCLVLWFATTPAGSDDAQNQPDQPQENPAESSTAPPPDARVIDEGWFAPIERGVPLPKLPDKVSAAFVIPIHGDISPTLKDAIWRKVVQARNQRAELVIFDMDTPGGRMDAMMDIIEIITTRLGEARTVAYVNPKAYSAGALIALACDQIVMRSDGRLGDAMPIMMGPGGLQEIPEKERGKIESATRAEIRVLARRNGYDTQLCEGMVTITMELWLVRNIETRQLRIVDSAEWQNRVSGAPRTSTTQADQQGELEWEYVERVVGPMELVTLTADEAVRYGISARVLPSLSALEEHYNLAGEARVLTDTWSEKLTAFLTGPSVSGILLFVAILTLYAEMQTPGFGAAGTIAIICFAVLFGSRYLVGMANWWEIALFVLGLILIGVEVFVIPGFGVVGVLGIFAVLAGLMAMIVPNAPNEWPIPVTRPDWEYFTRGLLALLIAFIGALVAMPVLAKYLPKVPIAGKLVLGVPDLTGSSPTTEDAPIKSIQVAQQGRVLTPLRPAGTVRFGQVVADAMAEGGFVAAGTTVQVVRKEGNRLVVRPVA